MNCGPDISLLNEFKEFDKEQSSSFEFVTTAE